jgi:LysM repeat protein
LLEPINNLLILCVIKIDKIIIMRKKYWSVLAGQLLLFLPFATIAQNEKECILHEVTDQDKSLWGIGQAYYTSVEEIQAVNELKGTIINTGQLLKIPVGKFRVHIVKKTDKNLWQISEYYQMKLDTILAYNDIKDGLIKAGDTIRLRTSELKNRITIAQSKSLFTYKKKHYRMELDVQHYWDIGDKWPNCSATIYLYKQKGADWILIDRMYHLHLAFDDYVQMKDFDENGIPDVKALEFVGARSYAYWNLVVADLKEEKLKLVEEFNELSSPEYDEKEKGIRGEYFSAKENEVVKSKNIYIIDYDEYKIRKIRSLGENL